FAVGIALFRARILAVKRGDISPGYFLLNRGGKLPENLVRVDQNYNNLLELPILFYAAVLLLYVTGTANLAQLWLLWGFALSRIVHTLIHIRSNHLRWRMRSFVVGFLLLLASWSLFLWQVLHPS
ncbi:MAG TPA: MAPEG family protein, partial [Gammaproteobacteria bacterium]